MSPSRFASDFGRLLPVADEAPAVRRERAERAEYVRAAMRAKNVGTGQLAARCAARDGEDSYGKWERAIQRLRRGHRVDLTKAELIAEELGIDPEPIAWGRPTEAERLSGEETRLERRLAQVRARMRQLGE